MDDLSSAQHAIADRYVLAVTHTSEDTSRIISWEGNVAQADSTHAHDVAPIPAPIRRHHPPATARAHHPGARTQASAAVLHTPKGRSS
jgi:hypothetical protein